MAVKAPPCAGNRRKRSCALRNPSSCTRGSISPATRRRPGAGDMPIVDDIAGLRRILTRSRTIAVVGLSANWYRPSYFAAKYMRDHGYRIIPVNPTYDEVMGERCYPDLPSAREGAAIPIDIVDCFRKPAEIPP